MGTPVKRRARACSLAALLALTSGWVAAGFDPTAPPKLPASGDAAGTDAVPGLVWVRVNGPHSIAWYGGTVVRLGDQVEGGRITAIREDHIVITGSQGRRTVPLLGGPIRKEGPSRAGKTR